MKNTILKITLLVLLAVLIFQPLNALADGGMIPPDYRYQDVFEPSQAALIVFDNSQEDLYLKVNYEGNTNEFAWIIPTPSMPKASKAPNDLFEELSNLTTEISKREVGFPSSEYIPSELGVPGGIIVHSQEQVGVYEITVLSATKDDNLYDWLKDNGYFVPEEIKNLLDWYVDKEWYFTIAKVDPEGVIQEAVVDLKKIDSQTNPNNLAEKLAESYINSFRNHDYDLFKEIWPIIMEIFLTAGTSDTSWEIDQNEFDQMIADQSYDDYNEDDWTSEKNSTKEILDYSISAINPQDVSKYSGYLHPIKLSFAVNSIVYPLKISQISTKVPEDPDESPKTNEILIYVLSNGQVKAPWFALEYNQIVNQETLEQKENESYSDLNSLKEIITKEYFLTKLRREFAKIEMDQDVYFTNVDGGEEYLTLSATETKKLSETYTADEKYQKQINKVQGTALLDRLRGRIILRAEANGEAYYINPITKIKKYLGRPDDAFAVMREQGIGITNDNLAKIPIALSDVTSEDTDSDGLPDTMETSLGTNIYKADSDGDGYDDKTEVINNYNPNGAGKLPIKTDFVGKHSGKIFLQVEKNGEAWYLNPVDGKRYYLGLPADAFSIMRNLALGISEIDFEVL